MGIDIERGGRVKAKKRVCKSNNPYLRLLCKLYKFMSRRTDSKFNKVRFIPNSHVLLVVLYLFLFQVMRLPISSDRDYSPTGSGK